MQFLGMLSRLQIFWLHGVNKNCQIFCYNTYEMTKLSRDDVLKLTRLSKLSLTDDEIAKYQEELGQLLKYVEQLHAVDTTGLEPTYQVTGLTNVMRPDIVEDYGMSTEDLLQNAPEIYEQQIKVRRVL